MHSCSEAVVRHIRVPPTQRRAAPPSPPVNGLNDERVLSERHERTQQQLDDLLAGLDVTLSDDVLDRIDEIVPARHRRRRSRPGLPAAGLEDSSLRRRPLAPRAAA